MACLVEIITEKIKLPIMHKYIVENYYYKYLVINNFRIQRSAQTLMNSIDSFIIQAKIITRWHMTHHQRILPPVTARTVLTALEAASIPW
jgi:hypothetical protein